MAKNKKVRCPNKRCKSYNVEVVSTSGKGYSVKKGLAGAAVAGILTGGMATGLGALAGRKKKDDKAQFHCKDCGELFEVKLK